jgi:hypothetical protein
MLCAARVPPCSSIPARRDHHLRPRRSPTSQNRLAIEADLPAVPEAHMHLPDERLAHRCEQSIRNHDPCIPCATHFLTLTVDHG